MYKDGGTEWIVSPLKVMFFTEASEEEKCRTITNEIVR